MSWSLRPDLSVYLLIASLIVSPLPDLIGHWRKPNRLPQAFLVIVSLLGLLFSSAPFVLDLDSSWPFVVFYGQPGLGTCLLVDRASLFLASAALLIALSASIFVLSQPSLPHGYCVAFTALMAGMIGVLSAGDLLTFYVFWEIMCLAAYALVAMGERREEALEAAWKYFIMGSAGAIVMLFGISILYGLAGTLNMIFLARRLLGARDPWLLMALVLFIGGAGVEAAFVPLHTWLPDAYSEAPTPVSATIAGITTEIGFFGLLKVVFVVFRSCSRTWQAILAAVCVANMFLGNLCALVQMDVKRFLAYPSISIIGYATAALVVSVDPGLSEGALAAVLFLILSHGISKALAFLGAGPLASAVGSRDLRKLGAAKTSFPVTTVLFVLALLCRAGLPGTCGFVEKLALLPPLFSSPAYWWLGIIMVINVIIAAAAYFRGVLNVVRTQGRPNGRRSERKAELAAMLILSALIVFLGIWPYPALRAAELGAKDLSSLGRYIEALGR